MNSDRRHDRTAGPWAWVPSLYFAEGIPYFLVNTISVIMLNNMGMPKGEMALYTSLLYLPWVVKPLWSPFVDILRSKRWWIVLMQWLLAALFLVLALSLPSSAAIGERGAGVSVFAVTLVLFWLTAFASATHDIAADGFYMLALGERDRSFFVGIRSTFYRFSSIFGQGVLVVIAGMLERRMGDVPAAWRLTIVLCSALFALTALHHLLFLPRPASDAPRYTPPSAILREFASTFVSFFRKPAIGLSLAFMLLYRLPEAFLVKMLNPFLMDSSASGGLALGTESVGLVYGTIGAAALVVGGILGGMAAARWGLSRCLWPMALSLALPCGVFVLLSWTRTSDLWLISSCVALDQLGYGFGFTAYMLYLMRFAEGEFKTAHYSICTGFMALSMMIPGMVAGYLQEWLGYRGFFLMVMLFCLATVAVTLLLSRRLSKE